MNINWKAIRPLNGSQANGFEELCAQLAQSECPVSSCFIRKGTPDAGVECYASLSDGTEWGWQAKYFDGLESSQWSQVDKSVRTAIQKHPRLVRYYVCVPLDLPDARISGRISARERWDKHVKTWTKCASKRGMAVEFIFWGSYELIERLSRPQHIGRLRFWFDIQIFNEEWFLCRLEEALRTAGPRYTPEIHVDLPIADEFEAFGRTAHFFNKIKAHARQLREKLHSFRFIKPDVEELTSNDSMSRFQSAIQAILTEFAEIQIQPIGQLSFSGIASRITVIEETAKEVIHFLKEREAKGLETKTIKLKSSHHQLNPFRDRLHRLSHLISALRTTREALAHADCIAGRNLLILRGLAGTGKTHLLCDVARQRLKNNRPTVLLMGQRFVSIDAPWTQALQQLDLSRLSAEEFAGTLESAAQTAGSRALVMIDALNEGNGRSIWPNNLAAFLAPLERSAWISVVFSVRSSYEEIVVPEEVRKRAVIITHVGFMGHEYDATKSFFAYYSLELPSTPLLSPEFRNPLFLKTICCGLKEKGERRLPRGFHGITSLFEMYINAINHKLALDIDFDSRCPLVWQALEAFSQALVDSGERWLTLPKAKEVVDALLPGRDYARSLFYKLVFEGILAEEAVWLQGEGHKEVVSIAYDRFTDHIIAKALLDRYLDGYDPASTFAQGGPLSFLGEKNLYVAPGLIEALCIQIPERTGQELIFLSPGCLDRRKIGDAFRQSLIWRSLSAFSEATYQALNILCNNEHDLTDTIEILLTVATLPGHPLNARFLDRRLRRDTMPDRDSWWSVYLHQAWGEHGAVDRLVDWASSVNPDSPIEHEIVDLCATTLSWMLSTSNRFLRDRATKALVSLLTGRPTATIRLIEQFANVDDPYVVERIYAVAYGTSMRCNDKDEAHDLATCVYNHVFADGPPPTHVLLRDYTRGVVERALYLGADLDIDVNRIRPPYNSTWPAIPSEDDIKPLLPDRSHGCYDNGDLDWAKYDIVNSILHGDFARYVIGTNSSSTSRSWLSLKLGDQSWKSISRPETLLDGLISEFSKSELEAWNSFYTAEEEQKIALRKVMSNWLSNRMELKNESGKGQNAINVASKDCENVKPPEVISFEKKRSDAIALLAATITDEHARRLAEIYDLSKGEVVVDRPPRFELRQIQRYVLWRVFDLGWTKKRFGRFDRFGILPDGREASKAERIGKKYQWIAYHEIMAMVADNFQYLEQFHEEDGDKEYNGPWQEHLRDIDPSCTLRSSRGGTSWEGHRPAWWGSSRIQDWGDDSHPRDWVLSCDALPRVEELLRVQNPHDGSGWLNGHGYFSWKQPAPSDRDPYDLERREIWYQFLSYLIHAGEAMKFMKWAEGVDFWGRWMPEPPQAYRMFLGEHGWAPASQYFQKQYNNDDGWIQPNHGCPAKVRPIAFEYLNEGRGFDCSVDEGYTLRLPASEIMESLGMRWSGNAADYIDPVGRLVAQDPTAREDGPTGLLLREDVIREFLIRERLAFVWVFLGEKLILGSRFAPINAHPRLRLSGAFILGDNRPDGFLKCFVEEFEDQAAQGNVAPSKIIRCQG